MPEWSPREEEEEKFEGEVDEEVLPVRFSSSKDEVVGELGCMDEEGYNDPQEGQRSPVGMVGDGKQV